MCHELSCFFGLLFKIEFVFVPAFDFLLRQLPDLILDTPDAPDILGNFMARAIADTLGSRYRNTYKEYDSLSEQSICSDK
jgi:hypothetical protein